MFHRPGLKIIFASVMLATISGAATALDYPNRPITLIVPWPAGARQMSH